MARKVASPGKATTIDEYLSVLGAEQRAALERLRQVIRSAAPKAEECISYRLPAFRQDGMLVGFGATDRHCALYLMSDTTVEEHRSELDKYDTSKGTIRFSPEKPLPTALVRKLVKARIAENVARSGGAAKSPAKKSGAARRSSPEGSDVLAFLGELDHPLKKEIEEVRRIILSASKEIGEGIKWNAPSFRTTEYFATVNLRSRDAVQLIFHLGAKTRATPAGLKDVSDPQGLLKWLAKDRCMVTLGPKSIRSNRGALQGIVREWIRHV